MHVSFAQLFHYPPNKDWRTVDVDSPDLVRVENLIRKLDGNEFPYLWLLHTKIDDDVPEDFMAITGGRDEYRITHYLDGNEFNYTDPSRPMEDWIEICPARIMGTQPLRYLCSDVKLVIEIATRFATDGQRLPGLNWK